MKVYLVWEYNGEEYEDARYDVMSVHSTFEGALSAIDADTEGAVFEKGPHLGDWKETKWFDLPKRDRFDCQRSSWVEEWEVQI